MSTDTFSEKLGIAGFTFLLGAAIVGAPLLVAGGIVEECGNVREGRRLDREQGLVHCGAVDVTTPAGNHAVEQQCWRAKNDAGAR